MSGSYLTAPRWYQSLGDDLPASIAYFSPEFGIAAALPQYSGGLGILAGDHLKSASDLGVPILGVGLFYRAGYFRQSIGDDGWLRVPVSRLGRYAVVEGSEDHHLPVPGLHPPPRRFGAL